MSVPLPPRGQHDWPFLGTYLLSAIFNMTLLVLNFTTPPKPRTKYDFILVGIAATRTLLFLLLAVLSEINRTRLISLPDTESNPSQPLKTNGSAHYGTFDSGPTHPHAGRGGFGTNPPPQGGWVTYIKSFRVLLSGPRCSRRSSSLIYGQVRTVTSRELWSSASVFRSCGLN